MSLPLVTAIVPNYNYAPSLGLCLRALREQTYPNLEILVVDDCSTDDSVRAARDLGVRVITRGSNGGCAAARNTGAEQARGEVLFFVDSDVAVDPDAVANAVAALRADPRLGAVCGIVDPTPLIRGGRFKEYRALQFHYWAASSEGEVSFLFPAMCAIRAETFAAVGPFNSRLKQTEEVDYGHRMSLTHPIRLDRTVGGRHDPDPDLPTLARKLFQRGRARVPLYLRARAFAKGFETPARVAASAASTAAVLTAWLPFAFGPVWTLLPLAALAASIGLDAGMYRFVLSRRGPAFLAYFTGVQALMNLTVCAAAGTGLLHWLVSPRFRRIYDREVTA